MCQNSKKCPKLVKNRPKWSKIVQNGAKQAKMVQNCPKMVKNSPKMAKIRKKWPIFNVFICALTDINKSEVPSHFQEAYHEACKRAKVNSDAKFEKK